MATDNNMADMAVSINLKSGLTPRKRSSKSNICAICAFAFVETVFRDSSVINITHFTRKLKLTPEKKDSIKNVVASFDASILPKESGICIKCWTKIDGLNRSMSKIEREKNELQGSWKGVADSLLESQPPRVKRLLRSPLQPAGKRFYPSNVSGRFILQSMPKEIQPRRDQEPIKAKKSLFSSVGKENFSPIQGDGEVEVTVFYPSGKKTTLITNEKHKKICKAVARGIKVEQAVVETLCNSHPMEVVKGSAGIISKECKDLCKRGSGSILQKKGYDEFFEFTFEKLNEELKSRCPGLLYIITASICDITPSMDSKPFRHIMLSAAVCLHGRSQEMSVMQYLLGFILLHGGCTQMTIERLSQLGVCTHPQTLHNKLASWQENLDSELISLRNSWADGGNRRYQLVGDNWDKDILPSYRTSDRKTESLHLFNVYAIVDRVHPEPVLDFSASSTGITSTDVTSFIPSKPEQQTLLKELTFLLATSLINNIPELERAMQNIYPKHLEHKYSQYAGIKTSQYPLGLYDTNENKTQEMIQLLKHLSDRYVPCADGEIVESVFFGGDRLTDERVQCAQNAMANADSPLEALEGFISKTEDFHRLMNFLEAIHKLAYSTKSGIDPGTMYYFRNLLDARDAKGEVKNAYRPYKQLYYTVLDAISCVLFLDHFGSDNLEEIPLPPGFTEFSAQNKIHWLNETCEVILVRWFFDGGNDICKGLRVVMDDPEHPENYWLSNIDNEGRVHCHFCTKTYAYVGSLQTHELSCHNVTLPKTTETEKRKDDDDELQNYNVMLFILLMLHKNLDTAVDMGDGERSVISAKYELPIYNLTHKTKYVIGSVHITALSAGILPCEQTERFITNRFVNVQGGKNNNIALDEYLEMLNRDGKNASSGHKTKESIIAHSKEFPILTRAVKVFDMVCCVRKRKGFHHLPSYKTDVAKVAKDLLDQGVLTRTPGRKLRCKELATYRNPFDNAAKGLATMIHRHRPKFPFHRLRDKRI